MAIDTTIPVNEIMPGEAALIPEPELISDEEALKLVNDTFQDLDHGRKPFERQWYRNILFLLGNQWIIWDTVENKWRKKRLADWVPTPVTNKFASTGARLVSVIERVEPNWNYIPSSDSEMDISAAAMCKKAEPFIVEENKLPRIRGSAAPWVVYTGNAYLLSGVEQTNTSYKNYTDVLSPFEVYIDQTIEEFENQGKVLIVNRRSPEYVENLWGVKIDEYDTAAIVHYQESIGYVTSSPEITGFLASMSRIKRVSVKRLFCKPTTKYPEGLYIVVAGNKVVEKKALPKTAKEEPFIPIAPIKFDNIPGAAFGSTPMNDIVHKQVQRNKIESLIELIILRMGSPVWLMPEGTVVRNFSGAPGSIITWNAIGDKAKEPNRIPGEQVSASIVQFLAQIDKDIEELASTFEALKGQSPYSGAPGVVIEQLIEQGLTRFGPSLRNIAEGYRLWMKHQLEFLRIYGEDERVLMKEGEGSKWQALKFRGADIAGAINVQIESESTIPRSSQVETAKVLEAVDKGLVDATDPVVKQKILRRLKIQDLKDDNEGDLLRATQENETMAQGQPVEVTPFIDNHALHIYQHKKYANSDAGQEPGIRGLLVEHITKHNMIMDAELIPGMAAPEPVKKATTEEGKQALNPGEGGKPSLPENVM